MKKLSFMHRCLSLSASPARAERPGATGHGASVKASLRLRWVVGLLLLPSVGAAADSDSPPTGSVAQAGASSTASPAGTESSGTTGSNSPSTSVPRLTLQEAMKLAVERNPDLTRARLSTISTQIDARRARLDRFTARVDVSGGDTAGLTWVPGVETTSGTLDPFSNALSYGATATASVPLFTGGATLARIEGAELDVTQSELDEKLVARDLKRAVYQAYSNIQGYDLRLTAARESLERSREALTITQAKLDAGLAAQIEVNRFQVDVLSQEQSLMDLEQNAYSARQDLLQLLQLPGESLELADDLTQLARKSWPNSPESLVNEALSHRLELTSIQNDRRGLGYDKAIVQSDFLPKVSANFSAGVGATPAWYNETSFDSAVFTPGLDLSAGVSLSWNIFNLGKTRDQLAQLELTEKSLTAQQTGQESKIAQSVRKAHQYLMTLNKREPGVKAQLELARENLNIIQTLYGQGSATLLDLFEAQDSYRTALNQQAAFRIQQALAELELRWAVGDTFE